MTSTNPQVASTPELLSGIIPELFEYGGRPRSWSARSDGSMRKPAVDGPSWQGSHRSSALERTSTPPPLPASVTLPCRADTDKAIGTLQTYRTQRDTSSLRTASIRSSARDSMLASEGPLDSLTSQSQPRVATAPFARGLNAHPVEARGQIISNQQSPARSRASSFAGTSGRKQALGILRPLATRASQDGMDCKAKDPPSNAASTLPESAITVISAIAASSKPKQADVDLAIYAEGVSKVSDAAVVNDTSDSGSTRSSAQQSDSGRIRRGLRSKPVVEPVTSTPMVVEGSDSGVSNSGQPEKQPKPQEAAGQRASIWSRFAKLTLRGTAEGNPLNGQSGQQKAAIDHLREIEASQPTEPISTHLDAAADSGNAEEAAVVDPDTSEMVADSPDNRTEAEVDLSPSAQRDGMPIDSANAEQVENGHHNTGQNTDTDINDVEPGKSVAASAQTAEANTGWLWGWIGSSKPAASSKAGDENIAATEPTANADNAGAALGQSLPTAENGKQPERILDTPCSLSVAGDQLPKPPVSKASQAQSDADTAVSHGHNTQQQSSVLLPGLDIGERLSSSDALAPDCADSTITLDSSISQEGGDAKSQNSKRGADGEPLHKRLRTVGRTMMEMVVDMAPDWAQKVVRGQSRADRLGQRQSIDGAHGEDQATSQQIREMMDRTAGRLGRIAVIGIHGWFPIRMLQMIAGEPTGKSEKFCLMMRDALKSYLSEQHGVEIEDSDISLFPLVGEGRIEDRIELLLSQIVDSGEQQEPSLSAAVAATPARSQSRAEPCSVSALVADRPSSYASTATGKQKGKSPQASAAKEPGAAEGSGNPAGKQSAMISEALMPERSRRAQVLQEADTVFVVTHSQGTPVSAMLLERLLELGIIDTSRQRVGMLAMAGISHGPFPYLKDNLVIRYIESEAARELFELMDPSSYQSQRYVAALSTILHKGVRLICAGSWVDEVVPLYSAILQGVSHPNVYRAVYIDAPHYADDFLTNLIAFALRLRNMDIYDHDLLIHLSEVVAGSLWGHSGHSTVYGEPAVYKLSVKWLLYSTSSTSVSASVSVSASASASVSASASASVPTAAVGISATDRQRHAQTSVSGSQIHMSYRPFNAGDKLNPFFIPWIMRTLWDEPEIRQNDSLRVELQRLVRLFDKWTPETKAGKELKYRLEPVRAAL
ncbi:hypothetical protein IWW45_001158 [Coemansia sp. RSA 485]|nr:hypothetical protein IWW45_001158 [Coemansia sp. RSA 485]